MAGDDRSAQSDGPAGLDAQRLAEDVADVVRKSANSTQQALDDGIAVASDAVKSGAAKARAGYGEAYERGQSILDTGAAHTQAALDSFFAKLREGVHVAMDHPNTSYAVGAGAALLLLPGARRLLWRQTIGRFRSEEDKEGTLRRLLFTPQALFKSAQLKATHLKQSVEAADAEARKLAERLAAAQEQYSAGLAKLKATNRQLQALASSVHGAERKAEALLRDLRDLPSGPALALRAEVSLRQAAARRQAASLDRQIYGLSKRGF